MDSRNIDDPTNRWVIHPIARALVAPAIRWGVEPNLVSLAGLFAGFVAALAYSHWSDWRWALIGFVLMLVWHVADGLDGRVARATGQSSPQGRILDGLCDYGCFICVYLVLAATLPWNEPPSTYLALVLGGIAHLIQSTLYEGERARFLLRTGVAMPIAESGFGGSLERAYAAVATASTAASRRLDALLSEDGHGALRARYERSARCWLLFLTLLGANTRTLLIFGACLAQRPALFWWAEIVPLSLVAAVGITKLRRLDARLVREAGERPL